MKALLAVAAIFIALGIVGRDDYHDALREQVVICSRLPHPAYCEDSAR